ncbi:probable E3 ubiquitin-protein ligase XERICO [Cajanus cajan]|uniref:E3 ubiquitin-protein ligase At1g63170 n=1 Tax=Cajanus cajan TaxID=3821 RepID=A0A151U8U4_CAJCA|nr:probable E3 ubiquitin-protein ligase XERICO [Cajanus cajan]KYP75756.1 E3 ubiquitin-protein ligase At1g63170 [Cajanus cajan]
MGLSNFPSASEGVLPVLVMNTVVSVAVLKNMFRSMLQVVAGTGTGTTSSSYSPNIQQDCSCSHPRRVSITHYDSLCHAVPLVECCVCLSAFEANQEVSQLPCKHFFHRGCLDKWFRNKHATCPLCRSID